MLFPPDRCCHGLEDLIDGQVAHTAVVVERAGALAARGAVERNAELDRLNLIVAAPAGIDGAKEGDRGCL